MLCTDWVSGRMMGRTEDDDGTGRTSGRTGRQRLTPTGRTTGRTDEQTEDGKRTTSTTTDRVGERTEDNNDDATGRTEHLYNRLSTYATCTTKRVYTIYQSVFRVFAPLNRTHVIFT